MLIHYYPKERIAPAGKLSEKEEYNLESYLRKNNLWKYDVEFIWIDTVRYGVCAAFSNGEWIRLSEDDEWADPGADSFRA